LSDFYPTLVASVLFVQTNLFLLKFLFRLNKIFIHQNTFSWL